jgi:hypothetical protein
MNQNTRTLHRGLDRQSAEAEARDRGSVEIRHLSQPEARDGAKANDDHNEVYRPRTWRSDNSITGQQSKVLLMKLSERVLARGSRYLSGFLGKTSVVAFEAEEPDKFGNKMWRVFVSPQRQK